MRELVKQRTKEDLKGKKGKLLLAFMAYLIAMVVAYIFIPEELVTILSVTLAPYLTYGWMRTTLDIAEGKNLNIQNFSPSLQELWGIIKVGLLVGVRIFLWTLLFLIPGIIKMLEYSMSVYVKLDYPDMSSKECIEQSKEMMNGHKMDLFMLMLKYIIIDTILAIILIVILAISLVGTVASRGILAIVVIPFLIVLFIVYFIVFSNLYIEMQVRVAELYIAICERYGY